MENSKNKKNHRKGSLENKITIRESMGRRRITRTKGNPNIIVKIRLWKRTIRGRSEA